jgi:hypothetical protein
METTKFAKAKQQYGRLYKVHFDNVPYVGRVYFVFHPLSITQYRYYEWLSRATTTHTVSLAHEEIIDACVVEHSVPLQAVADLMPEEEIDGITEDYFDNVSNVLLYLPAGVTSTLANAILWFSFPKNHVDMNNRLVQGRDEVYMDPFQIMSAFICTMFGYKPEEVEKMTFDTLAKRVALAEMCVKTIPGIEIPLTPQDPAKVAEAKQAEKEKKIDFTRDAIAMASATGQTIEDKNALDNMNAKHEYDKQQAQQAEERIKAIRELKRQYMSKFTGR